MVVQSFFLGVHVWETKRQHSKQHLKRLRILQKPFFLANEKRELEIYERHRGLNFSPKRETSITRKFLLRQKNCWKKSFCCGFEHEPGLGVKAYLQILHRHSRERDKEKKHLRRRGLPDLDYPPRESIIHKKAYLPKKSWDKLRPRFRKL